MSTTPAPSPEPERLFRRLLIALAALGVGATAVELAMERHWKTLIQDVPWVAVALLVISIALLVRPSTRSIATVRLLSVAVAGIAGFGIFEHVKANYDAGPLDFRYANSWPTMSEPARWLRAATKSVGPSPVLAPGILVQAAICVFAATLRHPITRPGSKVAATPAPSPIEVVPSPRNRF